MTDHVYPVTEIYGTSSESIDAAIRNALKMAAKTIRNIDWFTVSEIRGQVSDKGDVAFFQVGVKIGFRYDT